jgi:hypothetical protein
MRMSQLTDLSVT